eukprot:381226_1
MASKQHDFKKLSNPLINTNLSISHILTLNNKELLIITNGWSGKLKEIWIYKISNHNYTKLADKKSVNKNIYDYTASLNENESILYLFGMSGKITKLNLKTKQFEISNKKYHCGSNS